MYITRYRKWFIGFSALMVLAGLVIIGTKGLDYGIEFTGGSVLEVSYEQKPAVEDVRLSVAEAGFEDALVQPFQNGQGKDGYLIKTKPLSENERKSLIAATTIGEDAATVERFNSIGPSVGRELRTKSLYALIAVSFGIVFFIAYAFRKVTKPVSSWKYGIVAVISLLHDLIISIGILTLIGTEIDTLYVVGLLSILGLSVNDTIVVFDRIRESLDGNKEKNVHEPFIKTVGQSIMQTMARSIFTSLTLVVVLLALYFAGPEATQTLALVLLLGITFGTYSSVFLAAPLLTFFAGNKETKKIKKQA